MKRFMLSTLLLVLLLPGCGLRRRAENTSSTSKHDMIAQVDIPVSDETVRSFFDEEIGEFAVLDDITDQDPAVSEKVTVALHEPVVNLDEEEDFSWVDEEDIVCNTYDLVYFDFDRCEIRADQEDAIQVNARKITDALKQAKSEGREIQLVVEGHSCDITRSQDYNFALSEKRARIVADQLIEVGVPGECIKVVGRGQHYPAIIDGQPVRGCKEKQWPNRRAEVHVTFA